MKLRNVVNIVADVSPVNFGVWKASTVGHAVLKQNNIQSFMFVSSGKVGDSNIGLETISVEDTSNPGIEKLLQSKGLTSDNTIIATHGSWLRPTRIGHFLAQCNYQWVYVPQGMLEPWSFAQKKVKKHIYYSLIESRFVKKAKAIRAVSVIEQGNLNKLLHRDIHLISNGVVIPSYTPKSDGEIVFLFMARLHHKKGIYPLVKAWDAVMRNANARLIICGFDEGELPKISSYITGNIEYRNFISGEEKTKLLLTSHYMVLPTSSEGLPSGVLEGMSYGLIPVISDGCNLPDVFRENLGFRVEQDENSIASQLKTLGNSPYDHNLSKRNHDYARNNFSEDRTGDKLLDLYRQLM